MGWKVEYIHRETTLTTFRWKKLWRKNYSVEDRVYFKCSSNFAFLANEICRSNLLNFSVFSYSVLYNIWGQYVNEFIAYSLRSGVSGWKENVSQSENTEICYIVKDLTSMNFKFSDTSILVTFFLTCHLVYVTLVQ